MLILHDYCEIEASSNSHILQTGKYFAISVFFSLMLLAYRVGGLTINQLLHITIFLKDKTFFHKCPNM